MTRWFTISTLFCCCLTAQAADGDGAAQPEDAHSRAAPVQLPDFERAQVKASRVAGNIYLLRSETGGNIAASVGEDGVLLVDASYRQMLDKTRAALARITDKPVRYLIDTHYHADHTGGNAGFPDAVIVAHANVLRRLASGGVGGNFANFRFEYAPLPVPALPKLTFEREFTLPFNGEEVRVLHHPESHTDGDAIVYFPKANVVHMGDQFTVYGFPDIDIAGGGTAAGWIAALDDIARILPADVKVIPGHGPVSSMSDVKRFRNMLSDTLDAVRAAVLEGKTPQQMKEQGLLKPWKQWAGFFSAEDYLDMLYNDVAGIEEWPKPLEVQP